MMISAACGAAVILVVSMVTNWSEPGGGVVAGARGTGSSTTTAPPPVFEAKSGTCLNWTESNATDARQLNCSDPHLFEVTGTVELGPELGPNAPYPTTEQWMQIKQQRCTEVAVRYLKGDFDEEGRFIVGAFPPPQESWANGDRTLHCGLQRPGPAGELLRFSGSVRDLDQSDVYDIGTCLGISGAAMSGPTSCAEPHSVEVTGIVDLGKEFSAGYPPSAKQDPFLATKCNELTAKYAGSPTAAKDKKLTVYWDTLSKQSWEAGSRKVDCKVSALLPDDAGFAPVTGSIAGQVQIGTEPAPTDSSAAPTTVPETGTETG